jgi:AcrR family transcriptional regulator
VTAPATVVRPRYDLGRVLAVAVDVFTERGYDGTSMEHLASASGLSKSSLYHHIESKEQLLRLALERAVEPLYAVVEEPAATSGGVAGPAGHRRRRPARRPRRADDGPADLRNDQLAGRVVASGSGAG